MDKKLKIEPNCKEHAEAIKRELFSMGLEEESFAEPWQKLSIIVINRSIDYHHHEKSFIYLTHPTFSMDKSFPSHEPTTLKELIEMNK